MSKALKGVAAAVFAGGITYPLLVRPWFLTWGATGEEASGDLPGDNIVPEPRTTSTRAVTIHADPEDVWPWLAQLGQGRGGMYSYDVLENLFGCDIHTLDRVVPELQRIGAGDAVRLYPKGSDVDIYFEVGVAEANRALVLRAPGTPAEAFAQGLGYTSWAFVIEPAGPGTSRLIVRWRCDFAPSFWGFVGWKYGIEPVHFVMERKMLKGIKKRAERLHRERLTAPPGSVESPVAGSVRSTQAGRDQVPSGSQP